MTSTSTPGSCGWHLHNFQQGFWILTELLQLIHILSMFGVTGSPLVFQVELWTGPLEKVLKGPMLQLSVEMTFSISFIHFRQCALWQTSCKLQCLHKTKCFHVSYQQENILPAVKWWTRKPDLIYNSTMFSHFDLCSLSPLCVRCWQLVQTVPNSASCFFGLCCWEGDSQHLHNCSAANISEIFRNKKRTTGCSREIHNSLILAWAGNFNLTCWAWRKNTSTHPS